MEPLGQECLNESGQNEQNNDQSTSVKDVGQDAFDGLAFERAPEEVDPEGCREDKGRELDPAVQQQDDNVGLSGQHPQLCPVETHREDRHKAQAPSKENIACSCREVAEQDIREDREPIPQNLLQGRKSAGEEARIENEGGLGCRILWKEPKQVRTK